MADELPRLFVDLSTVGSLLAPDASEEERRLFGAKLNEELAAAQVTLAVIFAPTIK